MEEHPQQVRRITALKETKRGRMAVFFDGEFDFSVDDETLLRHDLKVGKRLDERAYEQPYRRVKARTAIAPFTLAGMLTVVCLMILVIFGYVQLFEASSNVSALESRLANLKEQQLMLQSKYDAKIDLTAAEEYAAEIGLTKCQPEQIVYVSFSGNDQAEIYTQQRTSVFGEILDAMQQSILGLIEYLHPAAA